jgi:methylenetetrahydrofolate dehydrogenase (NADP+) / methenyltetrahydrofolate cyclohydrolase
MQMLKGTPVAQGVMRFCSELIELYQLKPGLAVLRIGEDAASEVYVQHKKKMAEKCGIQFYDLHFSAKTSATEILSCLHQCNQDDRVHGIIVQLPLPSGHPVHEYLEAIFPHKDVDGLGQKSDFLPCTPLGCVTLLKAYKINLQGLRAVVVGRSNLVGKPLALCLLRENATVTITHSHTIDLGHYTRSAELLCVGVGKPEWIRQEDVNSQAIVVDIGIHRTEQGLVGDVASGVLCQAKTPVPGGVGPMTVSLLMWNVVQSACVFAGKSPTSYSQFFERVHGYVSVLH